MYFHYKNLNVGKILTFLLLLHFKEEFLLVSGFGDDLTIISPLLECKKVIDLTTNFASTLTPSFLQSMLQFLEENGSRDSDAAAAASSSGGSVISSVLAIGDNPQALVNFLSDNKIRTTCYHTIRNAKAKGRNQNKKFPVVGEIIDSISGAIHPQNPSSHDQSQTQSPAKTCQIFNTAFRLELPMHDWVIAMSNCITKEFLRTAKNSSKFGVLFITTKSNVMDGNFSNIQELFQNAGFREEKYKKKMNCGNSVKNPLDCPYVTVFRKIN